MSARICLFPGSFDPITLGHVNIINRAMGLFDKLVIGIGTYQGLTVDFCRKIDARYILRGIRFVSDFEYERAIADMNHSLAPEIESIFLTSAAEHSSISSTLVRDVIRNAGDARQFLPKEVQF
jgi:pantetheine-phosphate adenylyltransferase